jgi:tRNA threonylcarbamoyladenosine modification (KEOPS) complex  Pcc1 subunit
MRLLTRDEHGKLVLETFYDVNLPSYAILSHIWHTDNSKEVSLQDLQCGRAEDKPGYEKIRFCEQQAKLDKLDYLWIDTCCINRSDSCELQTAINSMLRWYQRSKRCYVYLADVEVPKEVADAQAFPISWLEAFRRSRWFTRGWTLQELLAPPSVEFFSKDRKWLRSRISLEQDIHEITAIPVSALRGQRLQEFSFSERVSWMAILNTTIKEDKIYGL